MHTMGVAPTLRPVVSGADLDAWARLKSAIVPNEPVTAEQIHATDEDGRLLLLAELDGKLVGCGIAARSHFAGRGFVAPRGAPRLPRAWRRHRAPARARRPHSRPRPGGAHLL